MIFIQHENIWQAIREQRVYNLKLLILNTMIFYAYYYSPDLSAYLSIDARWSIWWLVCCLVAWSALLTILGYAQTYLTQTPPWLRMSNELIFPFYIFHQTVIVVIAYFVITWDVSILIKVISLGVFSFAITSFICFFIIKPFNIFRIMFGLKVKNTLVLEKESREK